MEAMPLITVRLLGVETPLMFAVDDPQEIWDALQEDAWVSWEAPTGHAVHIRPAYVTSVQGLWEPSAKTMAAVPKLTEDILIWCVGAKEPQRTTFDTSTPEEWPKPGQQLQDEAEWIGWSDAQGEPVMFQTQHLTALVYPASYDKVTRKKKRK